MTAGLKEYFEGVEEAVRRRGELYGRASGLLLRWWYTVRGAVGAFERGQCVAAAVCVLRGRGKQLFAAFRFNKLEVRAAFFKLRIRITAASPRT